MIENETKTETKAEGWHLDKRVPIATLFVLLIQIMAGVAWVTNTDARLKSVELAIEKSSEDEARLIRLEENQKYTLDAIRRVEKALDKNNE